MIAYLCEDTRSMVAFIARYFTYAYKNIFSLSKYTHACMMVILGSERKRKDILLNPPWCHPGSQPRPSMGTTVQLVWPRQHK